MGSHKVGMSVVDIRSRVRVCEKLGVRKRGRGGRWICREGVTDGSLDTEKKVLRRVYSEKRHFRCDWRGGYGGSYEKS